MLEGEWLPNKDINVGIPKSVCNNCIFLGCSFKAYIGLADCSNKKYLFVKLSLKNFNKILNRVETLYEVMSLWGQRWGQDREAAQQTSDSETPERSTLYHRLASFSL